MFRFEHRAHLVISSIVAQQGGGGGKGGEGNGWELPTLLPLHLEGELDEVERGSLRKRGGWTSMPVLRRGRSPEVGRQIGHTCTG